MQNTLTFPTLRRFTLTWPVLLATNALLSYLVLNEHLPATVLGPLALLGFFWLLVDAKTGLRTLLVVLLHYTPWSLSAVLPALRGEVSTLDLGMVVGGVVAEQLGLALLLCWVRFRGSVYLLPLALVLGEALLTLPVLGAFRSPFSMGFLVVDTPLSHLYPLLGASTPLLPLGFVALLLRHARPLPAGLLALTTGLLVVGLTPGVKSLDLKVRVIEPQEQDYNANILYSPEQREKHFQHLQKALKGLPEGTLVVIPEFGVPVNYYPGADNSRLQELFKEKTVLFGTAEAQPLDLYNAAILHEQGAFRVVYRKRTLVPRVEDTWLTPGEKPGVLEIQGKRYGILICLEAIYPNEAKAYQKLGVDGLIILTNTQSKDSFKHQMKAIRARAHETQLPILVASYAGQGGSVHP